MAIVQINYDTKSDINTTATPSQNKVSATDMNEIKSVVNTNANLQGDLANLNTTDKSSIVAAINELKDRKPTALWANPSPNNNFSSSQITLSSGDYDFLEIYYYDWTGEQVAWKDLMCQKTLKGYGTKLIMQLKYDSKTYAANRRIRYINNTTLAVDDCYATIEENVFTNNVSNHWCVPVKIYGYKY